MRVGLVTFLTGLVLYLVAGISQLSYEQPRPGWINPLWLAATLLVVVGLLVVSNVAIRAYRERT
jgi:hypothetical protein